MEPTLSQGDTIVVDTGEMDPQRGDVIALQNVVHRLVWKDPLGGWWHSGDSVKNTSRAPASSFRGVVRLVIRDGDFVDVRTELISDWECVIRVSQGICYEVKSRLQILGGKLFG